MEATVEPYSESLDLLGLSAAHHRGGGRGLGRVSANVGHPSMTLSTHWAYHGVVSRDLSV